MTLILQRQPTVKEVTHGDLSVEGKWFCYSLEDAVRDVKIKGETAIPAGRYHVVLTFSQRFQCILPLLENVPNYAGVRIHSGNVIEDTEGCLLVGYQRFAESIGKSRKALGALLATLQAATDPIWITVESAPTGAA